ncbi:MAG: hypothetical protein CL678_17540 [Bdellovibrionaceae bacterium]|nr:hypothetical protein [Pseudobdellovibrionaceae bacterium]|tara:strand:- start:213 stop:422 length:210 start_codon:yes stop_codon:yes gene_type:complete
MAQHQQLIPDLFAADVANAAAIAAIMLIELKHTVTEIEERIATSTASRTDLIQTTEIAQQRAKKQNKQA